MSVCLRLRLVICVSFDVPVSMYVRMYVPGTSLAGPGPVFALECLFVAIFFVVFCFFVFLSFIVSCVVLVSARLSSPPFTVFFCAEPAKPLKTQTNKKKHLS